MTKKLRIRFAKFECALVMQILEQVGEFAESEHIWSRESPSLFYNGVFLRGRVTDLDLLPDSRVFDSNAERDEYFNKVVGWITDEQFTSGAGGLKVGEMCEVRLCKQANWIPRKLLAILPNSFRNRYIACVPHCTCEWESWRCARPLAQRVEPKIEGDIYAWETEVDAQ